MSSLERPHPGHKLTYNKRDQLLQVSKLSPFASDIEPLNCLNAGMEYISNNESTSDSPRKYTFPGQILKH